MQSCYRLSSRCARLCLAALRSMKLSATLLNSSATESVADEKFNVLTDMGDGEPVSALPITAAKRSASDNGLPSLDTGTVIYLQKAPRTARVSNDMMCQSRSRSFICEDD